MGQVLFITGTDTNVGKTIFAVLLTRELLRRGLNVRAVKPLCSGGREDAEALLAVLSGGTSTSQHRTSNVQGNRHPASGIDTVNPWHFAEALTPMVAARRAGEPLRRKEVVAFLREAARDAEVLVVEGAGGLLSPLGEDFDARDLIVALKALPVVVAPNRLGAINQSLLVFEALPSSARKRAQLVLIQPERVDVVSRTNVAVLRERLGSARVHTLPRSSDGQIGDMATGRWTTVMRRALGRLSDALIG